MKTTIHNTKYKAQNQRWKTTCSLHGGKRCICPWSFVEVCELFLMLLKNPSLPSLYRCGRVSGTTIPWVGANRGDWDEFHSRKFEEFLLELKVIKINSKIRMLKFVSSSSSNLTWRDVQHIIANSARAAPGGVWLKQGHWLQNKAGFNISKVYGFGLMDAGMMVMLASKWKEVPAQIKCEIEGSDKDMWASIFPFFIFWNFLFRKQKLTY